VHSARVPECKVAGRISLAPVLRGRYDSIVSVLGNSHFHDSIFDVFEIFGGPCILHDSRLTSYYVYRLGTDGFIKMASSILGSPVSIDDVHKWLENESLTPSLFLERIIKKANPLFVHTDGIKNRLIMEYGVNAKVLPFAPLIEFEEQELEEVARKRAKKRLGLDPDTLVLTTFGFAHHSKGSLECIWALDQLLAWKIPAELFFVGSSKFFSSEIKLLAANLLLSKRVHFGDEFFSEQKYHDFMIATDIAIQLRIYGLGQPSGALVECISAGIPTIATNGVAESCNSPSFVFRIPDQISSLLIAEKIADIFEANLHKIRLTEERIVYLSEYNFDSYAERLFDILGG